MTTNSKDIRRKSEHLDVVLNQDVGFRQGALLDDVRLLHDALCLLKFDELDTASTFFGKTLAAPFMITSMTGGGDLSGDINTGLARAAAAKGIAFAVGSQRVMLKHPETTQHFDVRRHIPDGVLLGNIGVTLLDQYPLEKIVDLVELIEADGLCIHLNPAQEMIQERGERDFSNALVNIARLMERLDGRVLVKETGSGLSPRVLEKLASVGVRYIDVAGAGGTSWTKVESLRVRPEILRRTGQVYDDWGLPTAVCVHSARLIMPAVTQVIASGGIRNGLDGARAIALGADLAGFARPVLTAFMAGGEEAAGRFIESMIYELKTAMMLTGCRDIAALKKTPHVLTGSLREWIKGLDSVQKEL